MGFDTYTFRIPVFVISVNGSGHGSAPLAGRGIESTTRRRWRPSRSTAGRWRTRGRRDSEVAASGESSNVRHRGVERNSARALWRHAPLFGHPLLDRARILGSERDRWVE